MKKKNKKVFFAIVVLVAAVLVTAAVILGKNGGSLSKKEKNASETEERTGTVEVVKKEEAFYEEWLAAAAVMAVSMQYSDFSVPDVYLTSETELTDKNNSSGVYIHFMSGGEEIWLKVKPLEEERSEIGTRDLYTKELGFSTFDEVEGSGLDTEQWKSVTLEELERLIVQSLLVTVYEH